MFTNGETLRESAGMTILRVEAGHDLRLVLQSSKPEMLVTHWFNRQYVCPGDGCPACGVYQSRLTLWQIVTVVTGAREQVRLFECSPTSWARLRFMLSWEGNVTVPGTVIIASRRGRNKPVSLEPAGFELAAQERFDSRELLVDAVATVFKIARLREGEEMEVWMDRLRPVLVRELEMAIAKVG